MKLPACLLSTLCAAALLLPGNALRADYEDANDDNGGRPSLGLIIGEQEGKVVIAHIIKDTPADDSGLRRKDEIRKIDGERINSAREVLEKLRDKEEGDEVEIQVRRDGESKNYDVELISREDVREAAKEDDELRRRAQQTFRQRDDGQRDFDRGRRDVGTGENVQQQLRRIEMQLQQLQQQLRQLQDNGAGQRQPGTAQPRGSRQLQR